MEALRLVRRGLVADAEDYALQKYDSKHWEGRERTSAEAIEVTRLLADAWVRRALKDEGVRKLYLTYASEEQLAREVRAIAEMAFGVGEGATFDF